jgi:hypothetical protein
MLVSGLAAVTTGCSGPSVPHELTGSWRELGTERLLTLVDDGSFSTRAGAAGTWSVEDRHLVLAVETGTFIHGEVEVEAGFNTSGPYELDDRTLRYLGTTFEKRSSSNQETS